MSLPVSRDIHIATLALQTPGVAPLTSRLGVTALLLTASTLDRVRESVW
jgi:hypothetical protein